MTEDQESWLQGVLQASLQRSTLPQSLILVLTACLGTVALVGIVGNVLVVVFFHRSLRDLPQNIYVIALASLDLLVCCVVIPSTLYQDVWRESSSDMSCKAFHMLRCSLIIASAFLLCLIAIDRFVIICFVPGIQTGRQKSILFICLALALGAGIGFPLGLTTGTKHYVNINVGGAGSPHRIPITLSHCTSDYTIVSMATVKAYKTGLTVLFLLLLLLIVFFYANIFVFVRQRQIRWAKSRSLVHRARASRMTGRRSSTRLEDTTTELTSTGAAASSGRAVASASEAGVLETDIDEALMMMVPNFPEEKQQEPQQLQQHRSRQSVRENSVASVRLAVAQRHLSERSRKKPHIKTAKVLGIITFFYLLSYLPFFLVFHMHEASSAYNRNIGHVLGSMSGGDTLSFDEAANGTDMYGLSGINATTASESPVVETGGSNQQQDGASTLSGMLAQTLFYFYFINHGVNPIIYGCMNTCFRRHISDLYGTMKHPC